MSAVVYPASPIQRARSTHFSASIQISLGRNCGDVPLREPAFRLATDYSWTTQPFFRLACLGTWSLADSRNAFWSESTPKCRLQLGGACLIANHGVKTSACTQETDRRSVRPLGCLNPISQKRSLIIIGEYDSPVITNDLLRCFWWYIRIFRGCTSCMESDRSSTTTFRRHLKTFLFSTSYWLRNAPSVLP